ncbi:MAG TPA: CBS domain-containing protein [Candidatus Saccharimonadales bacterium]|nr:CBS domain-containing protein [Candidatus Saccharimonadales bacterium]
MVVVYILLALAVLKCVLLFKVYHSLPVFELKRQARQKNHRAARLYQMAAYEATLEVWLWIVGTASVAVLFIWSARTSWWLAAITITISAWLVVWARFSANSWAGALVAVFAPYYAKILSVLQPLMSPLTRLFPDGRRQAHTGLYEKRDLLEFIRGQHGQNDNRIPEADLRTAFNSLSFSDKTVGSVMTPRRTVKLVSADEAITPVVIDELHKTGFSRFPVVKDSTRSASPQVVGTLYINDLIGYQGSGKVKDLARKDVYFINESSNLRQALSAFLKTHHHLLVVVNSFEEVVGILSMEDVLSQILDKSIIDRFDNYDSLRAVAAMDYQKQSTATSENPAQPEPESAKQPKPAP